MKPTNNSVFCIGCQKNKMLFESQSKAENFIKYNREGILEENGKAPVRSYYCEFCLGYHVTSIPLSSQSGKMDRRDKTRQDKLIHERKHNQEFEALRDKIGKLLENAKKNIKKGNINGAEDLLDVCDIYLEDIRRFSIKERAKLVSLRGRVGKIRNDATMLKDVLDFTLEEQLSRLSQASDNNLNENEKVVNRRLANIILERDVNSILGENDDLLLSGDTAAVIDNIGQVKQILNVIEGLISKNNIKPVKDKLHQQESLLEKAIKSQQVMNRHTDNIQETVGGKEKKNNQYINKNEYNATLISLIEKLESIKSAFDEEDYDKCDDLLEIIEAILEDFPVNDENTNLIRSNYDYWRTRLLTLAD